MARPPVETTSWLRILGRLGAIPGWFGVTLAGLLVADVVARVTGRAAPGTTWSIVYGILAATLLLAAAAYGIRRRTMRAGVGRTRLWLDVHIYGGLLFLLLMLLHSGFRLPVGRLDVWTFWLSVWITLSGVIGVALQRWIPRLLTSGLSIEANFDRIPALIAEIRGRAETVAAKASATVGDFYAAQVAPALVGPQPRWIYFMDITGGIHGKLKSFEYLEHLLPEDEKARINDLQGLYRTKLELDAHYTLQRALRYWIYLHVPASLALIGLVGMHIVAMLWY